MTEFFLRLATKDDGDYNNREVRERVGYIAGFVGIVINLILSIMKIIIGIMINSIAVTADAFNNISDTASSIMTVIGFKLSNVPPDKEHPYGHGRIEYLTALMIALMVMLVGAQFVKSSIDRIINPKEVVFQIVPFILLVISISTKIWLGIFNNKLGDKIDSTALKATGADAFGDVFITSVVALSLLLSLFTDYPIDGYVGIIVSIFILYSGFSLVKETLSEIIGEAPSEELIKDLTEELLTYEYIMGVHDVLIHSYGPGRNMATLDVEIPFDIDVVTIHNIIDRAERELGEKFNMDLVIHMDPVGHHPKEDYEIKRMIKDNIKGSSYIKSIHDFNIIKEDEKRTVIFHVVIDGDKVEKDFSEEEVINQLVSMIRCRDNSLDCEIVVDMEYGME